MHLTLKTEATKPAAANALQQQARFDAFLDRFNYERPPGARHESPRPALHALVAPVRGPDATSRPACSMPNFTDIAAAQRGLSLMATPRR